MKKIILVLFMLLVVFITACQAPKKEIQTPAAKPAAIETPVQDATVNSVGAGINNVDSVESDLNVDQLSDLDSGLSDIEKI